MAAKGTESKNTIFSNLMKNFPDAFWEDENKVLRIPLDENGTRIEIKVTLTAAKTNLGGENVKSAFEAMPVNTTATNVIEPTEEEKNNVSRLIASLGL